MARLIVCRDYGSRKKIPKEKRTVVGYKLNLTKKGIEKTGIKENDELNIEYQPNKIIITKK